MNTSFDAQFLKAIGAADEDPSVILHREKLHHMQLIYERRLGEMMEDRALWRASRNKWRERCWRLFGLLMLLVAGVLWVSVGRWAGYL